MDYSESRQERPMIAFLFTGQGSQYRDMAKGLYNTCAIFKKSFDKCLEILGDSLPIPLYEVIWGEKSILLDESLYSQTAIFCLEYALLQLWKFIGVRPDFVLGPSAGAFCAAVAAEILSLEDSLKLVSGRGKLIQALPIGGMTSVKATVPVVKSIIGFCFKEHHELWLDVAVINLPNDIVVAGRHESLQLFEKYCRLEGIKTLRLAASQSFHSREIEEILEDYEEILKDVSTNKPICGYISGVLGKPLLASSDFNASYWKSHARDPIDFPTSIHCLYDLGCRVFIEIGPQPTLLTVGKHNVGVKKVEKSLWLSSLKQNEAEWTTFLSNVGILHKEGIDIKWDKLNEAIAFGC